MTVSRSRNDATRRLIRAGLLAAACLLSGGIALGAARPLAAQTPTQTATSTVTESPTVTPTPSPTATPSATPTIFAVPPTPIPIQVTQPTPAPAPTQPPAQPAPPAAPTGGLVQVRITYPPQGQIINMQPFLVSLEVTGIRLDAQAIDTASRPGEGHWMLLVDEVPTAAGDASQFSLENVPEGLHTLTIQIRNNDRSPLTPPVEASTFVNIGGVGLPPGDQPGLPEVPGGLPRTGAPAPGGWAAVAGAIALIAGYGLRRSAGRGSAGQQVDGKQRTIVNFGA